MNNATVVIETSAAANAVQKSPLTEGDVLIAVTPDGNTCTGETRIDSSEPNSFAIAEQNPQTSAPGYRPGDTLRFWAQTSTGDIYELTPTFQPCQPDENLCVDEAIYDRNGIYTITDFDPFFLPVELVSWQAFVDGSTIVLEWETATETNNAGFDVIMRPTNEPASLWEKVAFIDGAGTTDRPQSYQYKFTVDAPGQYNIRLRQVDVDGAISLSRVLHVTVGTNRSLFLSPIAPHPVTASSQVTVKSSIAQDVSIDLFSVTGQHISTILKTKLRTGEHRTFSIDAASLSSGPYVLSVQGKTQTVSQLVHVVK
ncbi:T9SS type A sorting domain-containing protein [Longibacter salinarum]|uniref:T9SS type A sorting domain-containing protein n=1 Tax=Longibacter salinarum TaxID=1850348 RepID=UPI00117DBA40|nr:T9SS type A sorting domain-containing protein [Longibacter salinarum]